MSAELPSQFSHDVKIEETAQGIRIHVHAYANKRTEAVEEAFIMYDTAVEMCKVKNILRAPMEVKKK